MLIGPQLGPVKSGKGVSLEAMATLENSPSVLFDALILPDGNAGVELLSAEKQTSEFIANQYNHGKTILAIGASSKLLESAGVVKSASSTKLADGVFLAAGKDVEKVGAQFIAALGKHRHPLR